MDVALLKKAIDEQMIEISKGKIDLRDDRTKQLWTVHLHSFLISKFTVTQDLYFQVMGENPSTFKGARRPVENVSWKDTAVFCNTLSQKLGFDRCYSFSEDCDHIRFDSTANGFRLPTEAEWEYACKAGTTGIRYGELDAVAWYKDNAQHTTHDVGGKEPNAWGLYDMLGNVWEWCSDLYDTEVYGSYRIFRGGGWCDHARSVMSTTRRRSHPKSFKIDDLGFRIAKNGIEGNITGSN